MSAETNPETQKKFKAALPRVVANLAHMALMALAIRDLRQRPEEEINGNKRLWYGIVLVQIVGPIAYFAFGRKRDSGALPAPGSETVDTARLVEA